MPNLRIAMFSLLAGCSSVVAVDPVALTAGDTGDTGDTGTTPPAGHLITERDWLAAHTDLVAAPLTDDEQARLDAGDILWDRVGTVSNGDDLPEGFITATGIRILPESTLLQFVAASNALPDPSDPMALAQLRADLGITSDVIGEEVPYDDAVAGTGPIPDPTQCTKAGLSLDATACTVEETCKVTCNLLVTTKGIKEKNLDWSDSFKIADSDGVKDSTGEWNADRASHFTLAYSCQATGCGNRAWSANVAPTNYGDGTMSATIAASTRWPVLDSTWYTGCSAEASVGASQTSLALSHNTNDCNPAQRLPSTAQALKLAYIVNSETKFSSGTDINGSFNINYKGNITAATANAANLTASGNALDNLKVDNIAVQANQNNNTTAEVNAGAAAGAAWRYASQTNGTYSSGGDTLSFLNQVQGPPQLNLTNACPAKSIAYKYDLVGIKAKLVLHSHNQFGSSIPFCSASLKAQLPSMPDKVPYDCTYTVEGSTDSHSCVGTTRINP